MFWLGVWFGFSILLLVGVVELLVFCWSRFWR